jgi:hypothetical protein
MPSDADDEHRYALRTLPPGARESSSPQLGRRLQVSTRPFLDLPTSHGRKTALLATRAFSAAARPSSQLRPRPGRFPRQSSDTATDLAHRARARRTRSRKPRSRAYVYSSSRAFFHLPVHSQAYFGPERRTVPDCTAKITASFLPGRDRPPPDSRARATLRSPPRGSRTTGRRSTSVLRTPRVRRHRQTSALSTSPTSDQGVWMACCVERFRCTCFVPDTQFSSVSGDLSV